MLNLSWIASYYEYFMPFSLFDTQLMKNRAAFRKKVASYKFDGRDVIAKRFNTVYKLTDISNIESNRGAF